MEFTLAKLEARRGRKVALARGFEPAYSEIWLDYAGARQVRFRAGTLCPPVLLKQARSLFDANAHWALPLHRLDDLERLLLKVKLYPCQLEGALFAARAGRVLMGDEMGLGKTIQAVAATPADDFSAPAFDSMPLGSDNSCKRNFTVSPANASNQARPSSARPAFGYCTDTRCPPGAGLILACERLSPSARSLGRSQPESRSPSLSACAASAPVSASQESLALVPGQPARSSLHRAFMRVGRGRGRQHGPAAGILVFFATATGAGVVTANFSIHSKKFFNIACPCSVRMDSG